MEKTVKGTANGAMADGGRIREDRKERKMEGGAAEHRGRGKRCRAG